MPIALVVVIVIVAGLVIAYLGASAMGQATWFLDRRAGGTGVDQPSGPGLPSVTGGISGNWILLGGAAILLYLLNSRR